MTIGRRMVVAMVGGAFVLAQGAAIAADLPKSVREATPADAYRAEIDTLVASELKIIQGGDAKLLGPARDELCRQVETTPSATPSASFISIYLSATISHLQPLLNDKNVLVRLNAAIVVGRMCNSTLQPQLAAPAGILMNDASPAVALWGIKAAGVLLPQILSVPLNAKNQTLSETVVVSFEKNHQVPSIVLEAYNALGLPEAPPPSADALNTCMMATTKIIDLRVKEFLSHTPPAPTADNIGFLFLTKRSFLLQYAPPQRLKVAQSISDLMIAIAKRAKDETDKTIRPDLNDAIRKAAGAMKVIMEAAGKADVGAKFDDLLKVGVLPPEQVLQKAVAAAEEVGKTAEFAGLKPLAIN